MQGMAVTQDSHFSVQSQCIRGTAEFVNYLGTDAGFSAISNAELDFDVDIRVEGDEVFVHPFRSLSEVERDLKCQWHDYEFARAMRVKMLAERAGSSWIIQVPIAKAALILFFRPSIIRDSRLVDLMVEKSGEVLAFGCVDSLSMAKDIIDSMCSTHLSSSFPSPSSEQNYTPTYPYSKGICVEKSTPHTIIGATEERMAGGCEASTLERSIKREKIFFMVRSTDAPRLIGSRGVNKRRIEELTHCSITLHTEAKKDGEFPVEISGSTMARCESAKTHIENFLNEEGKDDEEKKGKERPKVFLAMSPRKSRRETNSSHM